MAYKIIWTKNAKEDLEHIITYLKNDWTKTIAEDFIIECYSRIRFISIYPFIGKSSQRYKNVRCIIITKHNKLYYLIKSKKIILLNFFDTRQNPKKNPYEYPR